MQITFNVNKCSECPHYKERYEFDEWTKGIHYGLLLGVDNILDNVPLVEAIPKDEVKKFLEEGTKNVGNNVLAIVREDCIHKADYENRLKADKIAMLTDLQLDVEGQKFDVHIDKDVWNDAIRVCSELIQQRIDELKTESGEKL